MTPFLLLIGYDGRGGSEFWQGHGIRIEMGDVLGYGQAMEQVLEEYSRDPSRLKEMAREAGAFIRENYSLEAEKQSIVECWEKILGGG